MVHELTLFRGTLETEGGKQTVCFNVFEREWRTLLQINSSRPFFCRKRTPLMECSDFDSYNFRLSRTDLSAQTNLLC